MSLPTDTHVRAGLHEWLTSALPSKEGDELAYHLGDLHGAFLSAAQRIQTLSTFSSKTPESELRRQLSGLMGELYEHMSHHLDGAQKILQPWVERLYDEADARNEL